MAGRIVVFGATGYTGRLTAEALARRGARPVLAGRTASRLEALAAELGGLETAVADVARPESVRALVERGDVLLTTVGPFARWGDVAAQAAIDAGAHYLDSTGEPPFIRKVFDAYGADAERAGCGLLTAFGYDWVPGNLAGGIAIDEAAGEATRVDTGYYFTGKNGMSGGTRASLVGAVAAPSFAWRDGRIVNERSARRYRTFEVNGKQRPAVTVGASENYALPRVAPGLREVNSYLGWFGPMSRAMQAISLAGSATFKLPGVARLAEAATGRFVKGSTGGPDERARAEGGSHVVGISYNASGGQLAEVHVTGVNGYTFTAEILAWGAVRASEGALKAAGALGPVDAFGLAELRAGCAEAGLSAA